MLESNTYLVLSLRAAARDEERKRGQAGVATSQHSTMLTAGAMEAQMYSSQVATPVGSCKWANARRC